MTEKVMKKLISIYKSPKKEGMYIYCDKNDALSKIPDALLTLFGTPVLVTHMFIDENKKFAKLKAVDLLAAISEKGYYLQMPDPLPEYRQFMVASNQKI